ncbi:MAG TPA: hypothetical protein VGF28_16450 [Thermoanaerobaculia bacterium]|jgi:hypothetical protein
MKKNIVGIVVLATMLLAGTAMEAQITFTQKQTADGQNLKHDFVRFDNALLGRLIYTGANAAGNRYFGFVNSGGDYIGFFSPTYMVFQVPNSTRQMLVDATGVTIGSNAADQNVRLTVNGAIDVKGNIAAKYQDVAEWVPAFGAPVPGTVVILAENAVNHVTMSNTAYDTRVAGVVSYQPGVILGEPGADKVQVATTGRVKVKVDASAAGGIKVGDLLVTSDKPGVAMKSVPVDIAGIKLHRPGTVVGKALEPLEKGEAEILVLLSLQ